MFSFVSSKEFMFDFARAFKACCKGTTLHDMSVDHAAPGQLKRVENGPELPRVGQPQGQKIDVSLWAEITITTINMMRRKAPSSSCSPDAKMIMPRLPSALGPMWSRI